MAIIMADMIYNLSSLIVVETLPDMSLSEFLYKLDVILAAIVWLVDMIEEGNHNE